MNVTLSLFAGAGAQFFDNNGNPLSGGKIYTYAAGTTTPLVTYTTASDSAFHTNPIILDAAGRVPSGGEIWLQLGVGYKFVTKTSTDVLIGTYDNIPSSAQPPAANDADSIMYEQGYTVTAGSFVTGSTYRISSVGTTDFTLIGASSNTSGVHFVATGAGTGTGTAEYSRTVEVKLQETVSVGDFGAVGDGVTDDHNAWVNAVAYCKLNNLTLTAPNLGASYNIDSALNIDCAFVAGNYRVFSGAGAITIAAGCVDVIYSAWFNNDSPASTIFATGHVPNWIKLDTGVEHKIRDDAPSATTYQTRTFVSGAGVDGDDVGVGAYRIDVADSQAVIDDPTKAGVLYGIVVTIDPVVARSDIPNDDATGILVQNGGTQKATDAFYVGRNASVSGVDWNAIFSSDAWASVGISLNGYHEFYGIDLGTGTYGFSAIRLPNNVIISARNAANTDDTAVIKLASDDVVQLGAGTSDGSAAKLVNTAGGYLKFEISSNAASQPSIAFSNTLQIGGAFRQVPVTVASLPSASVAGAGARYFVSDATATTFTSVVAGGGSSPVPVYSDGTNWRVG